MTTAVQAYKAPSAFRILSCEGSHLGPQTGTCLDQEFHREGWMPNRGRPGLKNSESGTCPWGVALLPPPSERSGHIISVSSSNTCSVVPPPPLADGPHVPMWIFWRSDTMTVQTVNLPCSSSACPAADSLVFIQLKIFLINRNLMQQITLFFHCECLYHVLLSVTIIMSFCRHP